MRRARSLTGPLQVFRDGWAGCSGRQWWWFARRAWTVCWFVVEVEFTEHVVERFQERVRPALDLAAAEEELARLLPLAELTEVCPWWVTESEQPDERQADLFAVLCDGVAVLLMGRGETFRAVTVITNRGLSEETRERRNAARRAARAAARRRRQNAAYRRANRRRPLEAA